MQGQYYSTDIMRCNVIVAVAAGFTGAEYSIGGQTPTGSDVVATAAQRCLDDPAFLKYCKAVAGAVRLVNDVWVEENENTGKTVN